jgi:hypothetical protein
MIALPCLMVAAALAAAEPPNAGRSAASSRFALAVSSNEGAEGRARLWYADRDAERLGRTLADLGGFREENINILKAPTPGQLQEALSALVSRARAAAGRGEVPLVVFYYSGHADPQGLQLGRQHLPYGALTTSLGEITEGVRVAIVDACNSGAFTQVKGVSPAPLDFEIPNAHRADGLAILTSAAANEAAQESAAFAGSFFTHHLTGGLRGAADGDGDGRVTLLEAYRYAYHRTLASTASAGVAPQHPTYAMRLAGKGEVILADLRRARASLAFGSGPGRSYLVTSERSLEVAAEVATGPGVTRVALPAGRYRVERYSPSPRLTGSVELPEVGEVRIEDAQLDPAPIMPAGTKGGLAIGHRTWAFGEMVAATPILRHAGFVPRWGAGVRRDLGQRMTLQLGASMGRAQVRDEGVSYQLLSTAAGITPSFRMRLGWAQFLLGGELGLTMAQQRLAAGERRQAWIWESGPRVSAILPLGGWGALRAGAGGTLHRFRLNGEPVLRGSLQITAGVEVGL